MYTLINVYTNQCKYLFTLTCVQWLSLSPTQPMAEWYGNNTNNNNNNNNNNNSNNNNTNNNISNNNNKSNSV